MASRSILRLKCTWETLQYPTRSELDWSSDSLKQWIVRAATKETWTVGLRHADESMSGFDDNVIADTDNDSDDDLDDMDDEL